MCQFDRSSVCSKTTGTQLCVKIGFVKKPCSTIPLYCYETLIRNSSSSVKAMIVRMAASDAVADVVDNPLMTVNDNTLTPLTSTFNIQFLCIYCINLTLLVPVVPNGNTNCPVIGRWVPDWFNLLLLIFDIGALGAQSWVPQSPVLYWVRPVWHPTPVWVLYFYFVLRSLKMRVLKGLNHMLHIVRYCCEILQLHIKQLHI